MNLFNLYIFNVNIWEESEIFLIIGLEPININSVLATLRLSLLAINHFLRFSKSEYEGMETILKQRPVS